MRLSMAARVPIPWYIHALGVLIGVPWALFFGRLLYLEVTSDAKAAHITILSLMFLLGASIAIGRWFLFPVIQIFISFYGDYKRGGRRKSDPPADDGGPYA